MHDRRGTNNRFSLHTHSCRTASEEWQRVQYFSFYRKLLNNRSMELATWSIYSKQRSKNVGLLKKYFTLTIFHMPTPPHLSPADTRSCDVVGCTATDNIWCLVTLQMRVSVSCNLVSSFRYCLQQAHTTDNQSEPTNTQRHTSHAYIHIPHYEHYSCKRMEVLLVIKQGTSH